MLQTYPIKTNNLLTGDFNTNFNSGDICAEEIKSTSLVMALKEQYIHTPANITITRRRA